MLVSNFVIAYSDIRPFTTTSYSLQVTNLEDVAIDFDVDCHFAGNLLWYELASQVPGLWPWRKRGQNMVGSKTLSIPAGRSEVFNLGMSLSEPGALTGYVELRVPRRRQGGFLLVPQLGRNVRVLLSARRVNFRTAYWGSVVEVGEVGSPESYAHLVRYRTPLGDDHSSESIEISTGRAENEIEPEGAVVFESGVIEAFHEAVQNGEPDDAQRLGVNLLPEEEHVPALLDLLSAVSESSEHVAALNRLLEASDSQIRVTGRD